MLWKTFTAVKLCDELEAQGTRCEVIAFEAATNIDNLGRSDLSRRLNEIEDEDELLESDYTDY